MGEADGEVASIHQDDSVTLEAARPALVRTGLLNKQGFRWDAP
jgi:hypothetical protein